MYALAGHPVWGQSAFELLKRIEAKHDVGLASCVCLTEVIAGPGAISAGKGADAQLFMEGLEGIDYVPAGLEISIIAGRLRSQYRALRTVDALQLATALEQKVDVFVTNDHGLLKLKLDGLRIHLLGDPLPSVRA